MAISSVPVWHIATMKMIKINLKSSSSFAVIERDRFQLAFSPDKEASGPVPSDSLGAPPADHHRISQSPPGRDGVPPPSGGARRPAEPPGRVTRPA